MEDTYLYIVLASTPYKIGKFIRTLTGETYNHLSIALDKDLKQMYGFARRYYHTPFYGGFVRESLSRYHVHGQATDIKVCRLPVTAEQHRRVSEKLAAMYEQREHYLYNHLSVVSAPFGRLIPVKDAFICVEFGVQILHEVGIGVDPKKYYSVGDIEKLLAAYVVYTGPVPQGDYDETYFARRPVPHPILTSLRDFFALFPRLGT